ncbi:hypothetical protein C4K04_2650 [Pseudomonas chlororaphis]|uniref:Disulfide bond formation protein B n=1 Tax=Pseudomonas chlororaphis TaxID=587753 RepID=A0A3G7TPK9_9PSED|nr:disulfide bond formation protein B [Pseudomonas chlororaphis]AZE48322.1 hypothetical protein C4K04_2650 [Pseudomonas chlororaphis]
MMNNDTLQLSVKSNPLKTSPLSLGDTLNIVGLLGVSFSLLIAFYYQLALQEIPCPLCLLQRVGMIAMGFGFLMNIRFGIRSVHYGVALLGALLTGVIASRQMFFAYFAGG